LAEAVVVSEADAAEVLAVDVLSVRDVVAVVEAAAGNFLSVKLRQKLKYRSGNRAVFFLPFITKLHLIIP
jgi:hypothetical protein